MTLHMNIICLEDDSPEMPSPFFSGKKKRKTLLLFCLVLKGASKFCFSKHHENMPI